MKQEFKIDWVVVILWVFIAIILWIGISGWREVHREINDPARQSCVTYTSVINGKEYIYEKVNTREVSTYSTNGYKFIYEGNPVLLAAANTSFEKVACK